MKICVIGAGLSGLVTIKELKEEGHEVVCYEQGSATGGVFRPNDGKNPAYDEMSLTVSNYFMAFSSLPPEESERRFWTRGEYHTYLQRIAADVIIFNTGYQLDLSRFENIPAIKAIAGNVRHLYKHMLHPDLGANLAFIGFIRPDAGGVPACAELQARYWARLCSGKATLPDPATLAKLTAADAEREDRSFYRMPERSTLVRYQRFTDELAQLIGCAPRPPLTDLDLLLRYYFGSPVAPWFRLRGPGSDPTTAKTILKRLPIYFAPPERVGLVVTATAMTLAPQLDRLTLGRLGQAVARRRPKLLAFLQRATNRKTINQEDTVRSLCPDTRTWHNLKYKLHTTYSLNPKALQDGLTVAQLAALCTAEEQAPNALELRLQLRVCC